MQSSLSDPVPPDTLREAGIPAPQRGLFVGLGIVALAAPFLVYPIFAMKVLCFALFASAFNLLLGYVGLLSFGHAAFFGMAGYMSAHAAKVWGVTPEIAILAGTAVAALIGLIFGALAIRRQGIYFAMITLALAQMVYFFALQIPFTGGEDGIQAVPRGHLFGLIDLANDTTLYYVVAVIFMAGFLFIYRVIHSPFGHVLKAIRENEARAISLGYAVNRYKLIVFVISAALSGVAGATKAIVFQLASLTDVHWTMSGGAVIVVGMTNYLAGFGAWVTVIEGVVFVACVLLFRHGIVGVLSAWLKRPL